MDLYWSAFYLVSLLNLAKGSLLCSVCSSKKQPECEENPPEGTPCWHSGSGVEQSCIIIREYKLDTRIQLSFRRDCSTMDKSMCYNPDFQNKTVCVEICFTDNCNSSSSKSPSTDLLMPFLTTVLMLFLPSTLYS